MKQYYKLCKLMALYLISPASFFVSKFNIIDEHIMLFRMTINIVYYTTIVALFFLITNL